MPNIDDVKQQLSSFEDIQVNTRRLKITLEGFRATHNTGLMENAEFELTQRHQELIAECILQTIYNLGIASDANIDFTMKIEGSTTYDTVARDGDVMVRPREHEPYRRRIRNDRNIFKKKSDFDGDSIQIP